MKPYVLLSILIIGLGVAAGCRSANFAGTGHAGVTAVEISIYASATNTPAAVTQVKDPRIIASLMELFAKPRHETEHHRCFSVGVVNFLHADKTVEEFEILPGHDVKYYEYRYKEKTYRIDRKAFVMTFRKAGVQNIPGIKE